MKSQGLSGLNTLSYMGVEPTTPSQFIIETRDPTINDYCGKPIGTVWLTDNSHVVPPTNQKVWMLVKYSNGNATWAPMYPGGAFVWNSVTTNAQAALPFNGYVLFDAGPVTVTLPPNPAIGDTIQIMGATSNVNGFIIAQNVGQSIYYRGGVSGGIGIGFGWNTVGVLGLLQGISVILTCTNTNTYLITNVEGAIAPF